MTRNLVLVTPPDEAGIATLTLNRPERKNALSIALRDEGAAVNGPALAGGFDLAVLCDIRVAAETARFAHPEITFGDVVYGPLHDLVGGAVARDLCFTGRSVDAAEALRLHLVSAVVPADRVVDEAMVVAAAVARAPRDVLRRTKAKAIRRAEVSGATLDL